MIQAMARTNQIWVSRQGHIHLNSQDSRCHPDSEHQQNNVTTTTTTSSGSRLARREPVTATSNSQETQRVGNLEPVTPTPPPPLPTVYAPMDLEQGGVSTWTAFRKRSIKGILFF